MNRTITKRLGLMWRYTYGVSTPCADFGTSPYLVLLRYDDRCLACRLHMLVGAEPHILFTRVPHFFREPPGALATVYRSVEITERSLFLARHYVRRFTTSLTPPSRHRRSDYASVNVLYYNALFVVFTAGATTERG